MAQTPEQPPPPLTKAELRARVVGYAHAYDEEELQFWRAASDTLRGQTLYRLRARGKAMHAVVPHQIEEEEDRRRLIISNGQAFILRRDE